MELIKVIGLVIEERKSFSVISKSRVVNIVFEEVTHIRKFGSEAVIYTNEREYRTKLSLQEIMNELPANEFYRVHRSHIISRKFLSCVNGMKIKVRDHFLPISKYYKVQIIAQLGKQLNQVLEFHSCT